LQCHRGNYSEERDQHVENAITKAVYVQNVGFLLSLMGLVTLQTKANQFQA